MASHVDCICNDLKLFARRNNCKLSERGLLTSCDNLILFDHPLHISSDHNLKKIKVNVPSNEYRIMMILCNNGCTIMFIYIHWVHFIVSIHQTIEAHKSDRKKNHEHGDYFLYKLLHIENIIEI